MYIKVNTPKPDPSAKQKVRQCAEHTGQSNKQNSQPQGAPLLYLAPSSILSCLAYCPATAPPPAVLVSDLGSLTLKTLKTLKTQWLSSSTSLFQSCPVLAKFFVGAVVTDTALRYCVNPHRSSDGLTAPAAREECREALERQMVAREGRVDSELDIHTDAAAASSSAAAAAAAARAATGLSRLQASI